MLEDPAHAQFLEKQKKYVSDILQPFQMGFFQGGASYVPPRLPPSLRPAVFTGAGWWLGAHGAGVVGRARPVVSLSDGGS